MVPIEPKDGTRAGVDWWVSVKGLTPTPPSEPLKPSTGAAVRDHRNAVRDRSESLSAIDRNHCPHSPESAAKGQNRIPVPRRAAALMQPATTGKFQQIRNFVDMRNRPA